MILAISDGKIVGALQTDQFEGHESPWPQGFKELNDAGIKFDIIDGDFDLSWVEGQMLAAYKPEDKTAAEPWDHTTNGYAIIRVKIGYLAGESIDNMLQRVAEGADYKIEHFDDVCEVVETEFLDLSPDCPAGACS